MAEIDALVAERARSAVRALSRRAHVVDAYLFGSHVCGDPDEWSDIDIAVFVDGLEHWDLFHRVRTTSAVQKEVGDDIELHCYPAESLENPERASFITYVLRHGVQIPVEGAIPA